MRVSNPRRSCILATSKQESNIQQTPIVFLTLPRELRDLIYGFVAPHVHMSVGPERVTFQNASLILTCHRAASEFLPIFYNHPGETLTQMMRSHGRPGAAKLPSPVAFALWLKMPDIMPELLQHQNDQRALSHMLWAASRENQTKIALAVVARMVLLDADKNKYKSGLCHAIRHDNRKVARAILDAGADSGEEPRVR
jgi:hypothetical protein